MGIVANVKEFFRGAWIPEHHFLRRCERAGTPGRQERFARAPEVRFFAKIRLVGEIVFDIQPVSKADHPLVVLVDVPIVFGKDDLANRCLRVLQDGHETLALNELRNLEHMKISVEVRYFGVLAESAGKDSEVVEIHPGVTSGELRDLCSDRYRFSDRNSIQVAVNQRLDAIAELIGGEEVALLPPFAGG